MSDTIEDAVGVTIRKGCTVKRVKPYKLSYFLKDEYKVVGAVFDVSSCSQNSSALSMRVRIKGGDDEGHQWVEPESFLVL